HVLLSQALARPERAAPAHRADRAAAGRAPAVHDHRYVIQPMPDGRAIEAARRRWYAVGTMGRHRRVLALTMVLATAGAAAAQPTPDPTVNPYDEPAPSEDVVVGRALVARAQ